MYNGPSKYDANGYVYMQKVINNGSTGYIYMQKVINNGSTGVTVTFHLHPPSLRKEWARLGDIILAYYTGSNI